MMKMEKSGFGRDDDVDQLISMMTMRKFCLNIFILFLAKITRNFEAANANQIKFN